jgi:hypothetical protein
MKFITAYIRRFLFFIHVFYAILFKICAARRFPHATCFA